MEKIPHDAGQTSMRILGKYQTKNLLNNRGGFCGVAFRKAKALHTQKCISFICS